MPHLPPTMKWFLLVEGYWFLMSMMGKRFLPSLIENLPLSLDHDCCRGSDRNVVEKKAGLLLVLVDTQYLTEALSPKPDAELSD